MIVTAFYAGLLGLLLVLLSARVIRARQTEKVSLGHGGATVLERRIRAQGNLTEYAPIGLILVGALELATAPIAFVHLLGIGLLVGRCMHGWALSFTDGNTFGRVGGMILTLTVIGIAAIANVVAFFVA